MICAAIERCAGIDVGKDQLSVCIMLGPLEGEAQVERRRYSTVCSELEQLRDWLQQRQVTVSVRESPAQRVASSLHGTTKGIGSGLGGRPAMRQQLADSGNGMARNAR